MGIKKRALRVLLVAAVAAAVPVVLAPAASAATGWQWIFGGTENSSTDVKRVEVSCPAGKQVVGGGGIVAGGGSQVRITQMHPTSDGQRFLVTAQEDEDGTTGSWSIAAHAVCVSPMSGYVVRSSSSEVSSTTSHTVTTQPCGSGKALIGMGGSVGGVGRELMLDDVRPSSDLQTVTVRGFEDQTGYSGNWSGTAYAVCANSSYRSQLVTASSPLNSQSKGYTFVNCPSGTRPHSVSGSIDAGNGQVHMGGLYLDADGPEAGGFLAFEDQNGQSGNWRQTSYAICAP